MAANKGNEEAKIQLVSLEKEIEEQKKIDMNKLPKITVQPPKNEPPKESG